LKRLVEPALDGVVGHAEAGRLRAAAVISGHGGRADPALGVRGELADGARELAQVTADRVEQGADRLGVGLAAGPLELGADEVRPLARPGQLRAVNLPRAGLG